MALPTPDQVARRAKAALAYAGIQLKEGAKKNKIGEISYDTMARILKTKDGRGVESSDELREIAEACGVPLLFMEAGFTPLERPVTDTERRIYELEQRVSSLEAKRPVADARPKKPSRPAQPLAETGKKRASRSKAQTRKVAGAGGDKSK